MFIYAEIFEKMSSGGLEVSFSILCMSSLHASLKSSNSNREKVKKNKQKKNKQNTFRTLKGS